MSAIIATLLERGTVLTFDYTDATSTWDSTTIHRIVAPAGKRYILLYGTVSRDTSSTLNVQIVDASNLTYCYLMSQGAATGNTNLLSNQAGAANLHSAPLIMIPSGFKLQITCGTAQGASAYIRGVIIEVDD